MAGMRTMDDRFFSECIFRDEAAKLRAIRRAIPKWEELALREVKVDESKDLDGMSDLQQHWHSEYINDQYHLLNQTTNALFAGLAVSAAASVENAMGMLCAEQNVTLPPRANWGDKRNGLQEVLGVTSIGALSGFWAANRARLLGNCFKHNGGKLNQEWVDEPLGGVLDEEISYADEDWDAIIDGVLVFLLALVQVLPAT